MRYKKVISIIDSEEDLGLLSRTIRKVKESRVLIRYFNDRIRRVIGEILLIKPDSIFIRGDNGYYYTIPFEKIIEVRVARV